VVTLAPLIPEVPWRSRILLSIVMAGLDPATHAAPGRKGLSFGRRTGSPFARPVQRNRVGDRVKPGHDEKTRW
jgi:hypothetical protein